MRKKNARRTADPLIDEVRRLRANLSRRYNDDLPALFAHLRKVQAESGAKVVRTSSKNRLRKSG